jgi:hypothetical protein
LLLGAFCVGAPLCFPNLAIGQTATVQPEPSAGTAAEAPGASDEIKREMAELSAQLAQQRAESASQREELQRKFDEERSAREAAEAQILSKAKAEVESAIKANPRVGGIEGLSLSGFVQADFTVKQTSEDQLNPSSGAPLNLGFASSGPRLRRKIDLEAQKALENKARREHPCSLRCKHFNPRRAPKRCAEIRLEASAEMDTDAATASAVRTRAASILGGLTQV